MLLGLTPTPIIMWGIGIGFGIWTPESGAPMLGRMFGGSWGSMFFPLFFFVEQQINNQSRINLWINNEANWSPKNG
jgi:hypothetical protein